jgi:crotonobetainyl-CoA:carnitine CoA-transferase CaiB-like acyl-CoA transferase
MAILDGLTVLDLSSGISGPVVGMLLRDSGASVTRIEPPAGDPFALLSGYRVWNRGKRNAVLDLTDATDRARLHALVTQADVLIESYGAGTAEKLGVDYATLSAINPGLIYLSITGYGEDGPDADRPAIDALVAARTGQQWEVRGTVGGTIGRLSGTAGMLPGLEAPDGCWVGPDREGPLFSGVPWVSLATAYIGAVGVNAAIRARGLTGRGQKVHASLMHGVLATTVGAWQKVQIPDAPMFETWVIDPRAPRGFFRASDGRWTHHWVPLPEFILNAAAAEMQATPAVASPKDASLRVSPMAEDMIVMHTYNEMLAESVSQYPSSEWTRLAGEVGVPVQTVRSPEEALLDPLLVADGCVVEVQDPELGPLRQVGRLIDFDRHEFEVPEGAHVRGADTDAVKADADALLASGYRAPAPAAGATLAHPLAGITVLDLGLAVAGPFGTQQLAELGARVIKVNTMRDQYWFSNHIAMCCNRDKESIALNLKDPEAMSVLHRLVEQADVVQHNMRYDAAERLGVDYESLRQINPRLIYCHTLGHEQGPRQEHPGNDQTGAALAGTTWLDGGLDNDGRPIWAGTSLGDTGNGFLSAMGIIQALHERDRTGEGQFLRTSILYAHLLNASMAWVSPDGGTVSNRQRPDAEQYGWTALYRLYRCGDGGWICIAALDDARWTALAGALGRSDLLTDDRFVDADARCRNDAALAEELTTAFARETSQRWFDALDRADVPAEISDPEFVLRFFDDAQAKRQNLVAEFQHPVVGSMTLAGLCYELSDTPGVLQGGPLWPGQNSRQILADLGYSEDEVNKLIESGSVSDTSQS